MPRPSRCRRICSEPDYNSFIPDGIPSTEKVVLTVDEYEVIRLIDLEKMTHEQCAGQMDISRTTATEIYESAREKIADSLVNGKPLIISGGNYRVCDGSVARYCHKSCRRQCAAPPAQDNQRSSATDCKYAKEKGKMRIAVTYENGKVFPHFGHTAQFKLYDVADGKVVNAQVIDTNGSGHGALAGLLAQLNVDVLICGGIGGGAKQALSEAGIQLCGGVAGEADSAVTDFLTGRLNYDPNVQCSNHEHEHGHSCGSGHCGENKHGCSGN